MRRVIVVALLGLLLAGCSVDGQDVSTPLPRDPHALSRVPWAVREVHFMEQFVGDDPKAACRMWPWLPDCLQPLNPLTSTMPTPVPRPHP